MVRAVRDRVYIGCEGKGERGYAAWLQSVCDQFELPVHLDSYNAGGGGPLSIVEKCVEELRRRERTEGKFVTKAILLDSDRLGENKQNDKIIPMIVRNHGILLIYQQEIHEALLLRHFESEKNKRPPKAKTEFMLKKVWPNYSKPMTAIDLSKRLDFDSLVTASSVEDALRNFLLLLGLYVVV